MLKKLLLITFITALSFTPSFAGEKDEVYSKLAENLTSLGSIRKVLEANNAKLQKITDRLNVLDSQGENASVQHKKKTLDSRITALNKKSELIEQEIASKNEEIESLQAQLTNGENVNAWHKRAKCQVIAWNYSPASKNLTLTILDRNKRTATDKPAKFRIRSSEKVYIADKLPDGLQAVVPEGWTLNFDEKAGVAKINDTELDNTARTFTSGEAFLILKSCAMTIRPAEVKAPEPEAESESDTLIQTQETPEYFDMPDNQPVF